MAYHIYRTEAIILRGSPDGESNKYLSVYTRELGLVGATARSVRKGESKLRYGLQDYSISTVSLVRGRDVWRITNAVPISNIHADLKNDRLKFHAAARILSLLRRLVAGEERHAELYDVSLAALAFLQGNDFERSDIISLQLIAALRILHKLGYASPEKELAPFAEGTGWSPELLAKFAPHQELARAATERALAATQLHA